MTKNQRERLRKGLCAIEFLADAIFDQAVEADCVVIQVRVRQIGEEIQRGLEGLSRVRISPEVSASASAGCPDDASGVECYSGVKPEQAGAYGPSGRGVKGGISLPHVMAGLNPRLRRTGA